MRWLPLLLVLAACGDSSGPKGLDPTTYVVNNISTIPLVLTWFDQSGQQITDTTKLGQAHCVKFISTTPADSVRFVAYMGDTTGNSGNWVKSWSPWFYPTSGLPTAGAGQYPDGAEYWTLTVSGSTAFEMKAVKKTPC